MNLLQSQYNESEKIVQLSGRQDDCMGMKRRMEDGERKRGTKRRSWGRVPQKEFQKSGSMNERIKIRNETELRSMFAVCARNKTSRFANVPKNEHDQNDDGQCISFPSQRFIWNLREFNMITSFLSFYMHVISECYYWFKNICSMFGHSVCVCVCV